MAQLNVALRRPGRGQANLQSYDALLRGRYYVARAQIDDATEWFEKATTIDPTNSEAWGGLASIAWHNHYNTPHSGIPLQRMRYFVERTLEIDPDNVEALTAQGLSSLFAERNYQDSLDTFASLSRENPNSVAALSALADVFTTVRRHDLALEMAKRIVKLDPVSPLARGTYINFLLAAGAIDQAEAELETLDSVVGPGGSTRRYTAIEVALTRGDLKWLETEIERATAVHDSNSFYLLRGALLARLQGDAATSKALIAELRISGAPSPVSKKYSGLAWWDETEIALIEGRIGDALLHYRQALQVGEPKAFIGWNGGLYAFRQLFPEFYEHPTYFEILADFELDQQSLSRLTIPAI